MIVMFIGMPATQGQQAESGNHPFTVDGKKFFIKGIGYEAGATPGSLPWQRTFNPELLRFDMQRITVPALIPSVPGQL